VDICGVATFFCPSNAGAVTRTRGQPYCGFCDGANRLDRADLSTLLVAWVASVLLALTVLAIVGRANVSAPLFWSALIFYGLAKVIKFSIYLFIGLMIIQAVLSWVSPYHPLRPFFDALTRFLLKPFQRVIPLIGGIDLSPLFVIILLQVLLIAPVAWLEGEALKLLAQS
jgi:YggT family protein